MASLQQTVLIACSHDNIQCRGSSSRCPTEIGVAGGWTYPRLGLQPYVEDQTVEAIVAAYQGRKQAELYFGRGTTAIGFDRLDRKPAPRSPDPVGDVVHARTPEGTPMAMATVFRASCHPVWVFAVTISADFPGAARTFSRRSPG